MYGPLSLVPLEPLARLSILNMPPPDPIVGTASEFERFRALLLPPFPPERPVPVRLILHDLTSDLSHGTQPQIMPRFASTATHNHRWAPSHVTSYVCRRTMSR